MEIYPYAWVFFISFILIATFIIFNLFIAVIVDSITANKEKDVRDEVHLSNIENNLSAMRDEISELKRMLEKRWLRIKLKDIESLLRRRWTAGPAMLEHMFNKVRSALVPSVV